MHLLLRNPIYQSTYVYILIYIHIYLSLGTEQDSLILINNEDVKALMAKELVTISKSFKGFEVCITYKYTHRFMNTQI
jgi:hypothetical protein